MLKMSSQLHKAIELHDTTVVSVFEVGTQIVVVLQAYVHTSNGRPAWDAGSGWVQAAVLTFFEGRIEGTLPDLPADIWEGDLIVDGEVLQNAVPIPLSHIGEVVLKLQLAAPESLIIRGEGANLTLIGEAVYVEEFPGASNP
jgi:hypothetical protein